MTATTIIGGLDVGNGYVKGVLFDKETRSYDEIDIPSGVSLMTRPNVLPDEASAAVEIVLGDFFNTLDVDFATLLVGDSYRRIFGKRGLSAGGVLEQFDVVGRLSKAEQPLSKVLVLGLIAAKALRDYVRANKALPGSEDVLSVRSRIALALPIDEFLAHRRSYAAEFTGQTHTVSVRNFTEAVTIKIKFDGVVVVPEGASAQYAITEKGAGFMDALLRDVRSRGLALPGITAADVLGALNTVGIDVGEGTVNFPVFTQGQFNADASRTFGKGYGSVLENALVSMEQSGFRSGFTSRKQLADFLQAGPSALKRALYDKVTAFVAEQAVFFCQEVAEQFGRVLAVVGATTEVGYVYGGGAGSIKNVLYPALLAKVEEMTSVDGFPVLYLDSSYSRALNREGLLIASKVNAKIKD